MKSPQEQLNQMSPIDDETRRHSTEGSSPTYSTAEPYRQEVLTDMDADVSSSSSDVDYLEQSAANERPNRAGRVDPDDYTRRTDDESFEYTSRQGTDREKPMNDPTSSLPEREI